MPKDKSIEGILPKITDGAQEGLIFLDVGQRKLNAVGYPQVGPNLVFWKPTPCDTSLSTRELEWAMT